MKKILIVEDDPGIGKALSVRLKSCGYAVSLAPDAVSGVETALKIQPDLVLLDISMPAGDGFTVAERIQDLLPTKTPIIFLTASRKPGLRERAHAVGAAAFFQKPFYTEELVGTIHLALGGLSPTTEDEVYVL